MPSSAIISPKSLCSREFFFCVHPPPIIPSTQTNSRHFHSHPSSSSSALSLAARLYCHTTKLLKPAVLSTLRRHAPSPPTTTKTHRLTHAPAATSSTVTRVPPSLLLPTIPHPPLCTLWTNRTPIALPAAAALVRVSDADPNARLHTKRTHLLSSPPLTYTRRRLRLGSDFHHSRNILTSPYPFPPPFPPSEPTTPIPHSDRRRPSRNSDTDDADIVVAALRVPPDSKFR
ncbi:hypothetical protein R3P38DRAFT_3247065 [Favolaschia claudopus]|uniref:Uncharacterized protein n=1 Tax=Favolaschia claudopus TaxID=2862362 RepID=A0AAV9YYK7_9AGAR